MQGNFIAVRLKWDKEDKLERGMKGSPCLTVERRLSAVTHRQMRGDKRESPREGLKVTKKSRLREQVVETLKREQEEKKKRFLYMVTRCRQNG